VIDSVSRLNITAFVATEKRGTACAAPFFTPSAKTTPGPKRRSLHRGSPTAATNDPTRTPIHLTSSSHILLYFSQNPNREQSYAQSALSVRHCSVTNLNPCLTRSVRYRFSLPYNRRTSNPLTNAGFGIYNWKHGPLCRRVLEGPQPHQAIV